MRYRLVYTARAANDLNDAADYISKYAPETAEPWFNEFVETLSGLRQEPLRHGLAPENALIDADIRQVLYRTKSRQANRALFTVRGEIVYILCIRRPGQDLLSKSESQNLLLDIDKA